MPRATTAVAVLLASFLLVSETFAGGQSARDAFGLWEHPENGSRMLLYPCGSGLCSKIEFVADDQKVDRHNPDPAMRNRPIVGLVILDYAREAGPKTWVGNLYNRIDGRSYSGKLKLKSLDTLEVTGCTAIVICRSVIWRRVPDKQKPTTNSAGTIRK
jgi:uncharacterized protein (DUF2147 family)